MCPELCPVECAQEEYQPTTHSNRVVALSGKGDGLNAGSPSCVRWRVLPSKFPFPVYLQVRGEVAERLKAAVC